MYVIQFGDSSSRLLFLLRFKIYPRSHTTARKLLNFPFYFYTLSFELNRLSDCAVYPPERGEKKKKKKK